MGHVIKVLGGEVLTDIQLVVVDPEGEDPAVSPTCADMLVDRHRVESGVLLMRLSVEKSTDLNACSPILMQNTSDPAKAFYRLRIQR